MALVDVIKHTDKENEFIWKFPSEAIGTWSQLVVNPTQEVVFIKDGQICDIFSNGKYQLDTKNIPILNKIINIPFGGRSPFTAEVWYINKKYNLNIKWGTPTPIQLKDPEYNIFIKLRSFGQFGIKIQDTRLLFTTLVGTKCSLTDRDIKNYFKGLYLMKIRDILSKYVINRKISVLEINSYIEELSTYIKEEIEKVFEKYGISLENFYINDINVLEEDDSVQKLKQALAKKAEMNIIGYNYVQERSFDTLEGAATNTAVGGMASNLMGAGIGMSMGVNLGNTIGELSSSNLEPVEKKEEIEKVECKKCGSHINKNVKFCPECGEPRIKRCKGCGAIQQNENAKFCPECGEPLIKMCKSCKIVVDENAKFCPECGGKIE